MWDKEWLESLVANVPGAIYRCAFNSDWEMEFMSDGIEQITGYPAAGSSATRRAPTRA